MSLGWIEDVVRDGKVVLQGTKTEESEVKDIIVSPPTMLSENAIAA